MVSVAGSAIENLCGRFRHRKRSQNVVGRTDTQTQFVIIYKIRELFIIKGTNHLKSQFASFHQKMTIDIIKMTTVRGDPLFLGRWPFWWITRSIVDWTRWYIFYIIHVHMDHNLNGDLWSTIIINLKHVHILSLIISRRQIKQIASSKCHFCAKENCKFGSKPQ